MQLDFGGHSIFYNIQINERGQVRRRAHKYMIISSYIVSNQGYHDGLIQFFKETYQLPEKEEAYFPTLNSGQHGYHNIVLCHMITFCQSLGLRLRK